MRPRSDASVEPATSREAEADDPGSHRAEQASLGRPPFPGHARIRRTIDRLQVAYSVLVVTQVTAVLLYERRIASGTVVLALGLVSSVVGPGLSVLVGIHVCQRRRLSRALDIASVAATYIVTCSSFAIVYAFIGKHIANAFLLPSGEIEPIGLGSALYFSFVTITTTGYGDIAPLAGLARVVACFEMGTGLLYQVFVFTLAAALFASASPVDERGERAA